MERSWLIHESPGLKTDWSGGNIKLFSVNHARYYTIFFQIFFQQQNANLFDASFSSLVYLLFSLLEPR